MAAKQSRSSQPTIRQDLRQAPGLNPGIRASGLYSYTEARPSYVDRDRTAGSGMMQLARSLSALDRSLVTSIENIVDRNIERDVTLGGEDFAQNPDELKNQKNFKDYVEENPGEVNNNPWIRIGYERARLQALAVDEQKAMNDAFIQSGMVNETDQKKVSEWAHKFTQDFRKQHHLDTYEDKLTLARNFSAGEFKNREGLLAKHSAILTRQNEERAIQQFSELAAKEIEQGFGNRPIGHGPGGETHVRQIAAIVTKNAQEALAHGVLNANAGKMMVQAVFDAYERTDRDPAVLKALDLIKTPDGVALSRLPGVAKQLNALEDQRIAKARADEAHWWQQRQRRKKDEEDQLPAIVYGLKDAQMTDEVMEKAGIPLRLRGNALQMHNALNANRNKNFMAAKPNQEAMFAAKVMAAEGKLDIEDTHSLVEYVGAEEAYKLYEESEKTKKEADKTQAAWIKDIGTEVRRVLGMTEKEGEDAVVKAMMNMGMSDKEKRYMHMSNYAIAISRNMRAEYTTKHGTSAIQTWQATNTVSIVKQALDLTNAQLGTPQQEATVRDEEGKKSRVTTPSRGPTSTPLNTAIQEWAVTNLPGTLVPQFSTMLEAAAWVTQNAPEKQETFKALLKQQSMASH